MLENASRRISTGALNEILQSAIVANEPPYRNGKRLKIKYMTEVSTNPPTFIIFTNEAEMHYSYLRYLENFLRSSVDFSGTPIKLIVKQKENDGNS